MPKIQSFGTSLINKEMQSPSGFGSTGASTGRAIQQMAQDFERTLVPIIQRAEEDRAYALARDEESNFKDFANKTFNDFKSKAVGPHENFAEEYKSIIKSYQNESLERLNGSQARKMFMQSTDRFVDDRISTARQYEAKSLSKYTIDQHAQELGMLNADIVSTPTAMNAVDNLLPYLKKVNEDNARGALISSDAITLENEAYKKSRVELFNAYLRNADKDSSSLDLAADFIDGREYGSEFLLKGMDGEEKKVYLNKLEKYKQRIEESMISNVKDDLAGIEALLTSNEAPTGRAADLVNNFTGRLSKLPEDREETVKLKDTFQKLQVANQWTSSNNIALTPNSELNELIETKKLGTTLIETEAKTQQIESAMNRNIEKEIKLRSEDSAAYVDKNFPDLRDPAPIVVLADTSNNRRNVDLSAQSSATLSRQVSLGIQPTEQRLVTKAESEAIGNKFREKLTTLEKAKMLDNIIESYGANTSTVLKNLIDDKQVGNEYLIAAHFNGEKAKSEVLTYFDPKVQKEIKTNYGKEPTAVKAKVNTMLRDFSNGYFAVNETKLPADMQVAMQFSTMAKMNQGQTMNDAVQEAYKELIKDNYIVATGKHGAATFPKISGVSDAHIGDFLDNGLQPDILKKMGIRVPPDTTYTPDSFSKVVNDFGTIVMSPTKDSFNIKFKDPMSGTDFFVKDSSGQVLTIKATDVSRYMNDLRTNIKEEKRINLKEQRMRASRARLTGKPD